MLWNSYYRKSSSRSPGGAYLFQTHLRGVLIFLTQTMVLVFHRELEYKVKKLNYKKWEVRWTRIKKKNGIPAGE